jgi:hypothetical protein
MVRIVTVVTDRQMDRMEKSLEAAKRTFNTVRTGRANPSMLDRIEVCCAVSYSLPACAGLLSCGHYSGVKLLRTEEDTKATSCKSYTPQYLLCHRPVTHALPLQGSHEIEGYVWQHQGD